MDQYDLVVGGYGLQTGHITAETIEELRRCHAVYFVGNMPGITELLEQHCSQVIDLGASTYRVGHDRFETYKEMAVTVLEAAMTEPPVMFAMYGHPLVLSQPCVITLRIAPKLGLRTKVMPGISALDCLFSDLRIDPIEAGLQIHEATELLLYRQPLIPDMATVLGKLGCWKRVSTALAGKVSRDG